MTESDWLAQRFQEHRSRLRAVAYRMLGSLAEADDAVQEAWLRARRSDASGADNLGAWLTTIVARVCLNMLRSRKSHREEPLDAQHLPDPFVDRAVEGIDPEHEALLSDSVGLALLVVLETLTPAARVAFVLHDMFSVPFEEIAPIVGRSPAATRRLASRARRRVRGAAISPDTDLVHQREVVDAFLAAARDGERSRGSGGGSARTAVFGNGFHGQGREDRRDRHTRRPCAPGAARAGLPRGLRLGVPRLRRSTQMESPSGLRKTPGRPWRRTSGRTWGERRWRRAHGRDDEGPTGPVRR
jgi:RNA polymerase sigma factor (sigma-70 family)